MSRLRRGLMHLMHDNLHWLDVPERVKYKVIILTRRCLIGTAPQYLSPDCVPVSEMAYVIHLRSAAGYQLVVRSYRLNSHVAFGRFLYSVQDYGTLCLDCCVYSHNTTSFGHSLKTFFLSEY